MKLDLPLRERMTGHVVTLPSGASLTDAMTAMVNGGFHHLPVVDGEDLVGILSMADLLSVLKLQPGGLAALGVVLDTEHTVASLMTKKPVTLSLDAPVRDAVKVFAEHALHAIPVVAGRRLVGIFTTRDLARHLLAD